MLAMKQVLEQMQKDLPRDAGLMDFIELRSRIGFDDYYDVSSRYETSRRD